MKRVYSKILTIILVMAIILPANIFAQEVDEVSNDQILQLRDMVRNVSSNKIDRDLLNLEVDENEAVRIIVELNDQPIIDRATILGVKVVDMDQGLVNNMSEDLLDKQQTVIKDIQMADVNLELHSSFVNVFNGFSTSVKYKDIETIALNPSVKGVYIANEYERPVPQMSNSHEITESKYVNEVLDYTGKGLVVAVIDTGIDPSHDDFVLDNDVIPALDEAGVSGIIEGNPLDPFDDLPGLYFTEKVPYGYNYMDGNDEIRDLGVEASMHGMHVSGTVGANGQLKGVAPNVQLLAMKVFGNDPEFPSTFSDTIMAAIDDAIALGADVMNLSLGSTAAFVDEEDPEQMAITRAVDNGIVMSLSAGNSAKYGDGWWDPYAANPDIGVVGSPGLTADSIQVASVNNYTYLYKHKVLADGLGLEVIGFGKDEWIPGNYSLVPIGGTKYGYPEDYDGLDVTGKVVLVSRGAMTFYDKTQNAAAQGAIGIIVYNNDITNFFYTDQGGWDIPFMKVQVGEGLALEALLADNGGEVEIEVELELEYLDPVAGFMSDFSSWGTTPTMDLKPEISAPGGNIYSTFNDDTYGYMSGTSMAAPHVAGGSALVLERIDEDSIFNDETFVDDKKAVLAKNILMNTAVPVLDFNNPDAFASPRNQGAGSMNLRYAMDTDVVATAADTGVAKVNAGEFESNSISFDLLVTNYGDDDAKYELEGIAQTDFIDIDDYGFLINTLISENIGANFAFSVGGQSVADYLVVAPNSEEVLTVNITFDNGALQDIRDNCENGNFIEGFVFLHDAILSDNIATINTSIAAINAEINQKEQDIIAQQVIIDDLNASIGVSEAAIQVIRDERDAFVTSNEAIIEEKEQDIINADEYLQDVANRLDELISSGAPQSEIDYAIQEMIAEIELYKEIVALIQQDIDEYYARLADYDNQIATMESEIADLNLSLDQELLIMSQLTDELAILEAELADLEAQLASAEYYNALPLSVPYISFYGDWSDADAFDAPIYDDYSYYFYTGLLYNLGGGYYDFLGYEGGYSYSSEHIAISPNGDGYKDTATPIFSLLRNLKDLEFEVQNDSNETIITLGHRSEMRKNYFDSGYNDPYYLMPEYTWDGTSNLETVEDGQYYYVISGELANGDATEDLVIPVMVDTISPVIYGYDTNGVDTLTVHGFDTGVGIDTYFLFDFTGDEPELLMASKNGVFDLTELENRPYIVGFYAIDYADNDCLYPQLALINDGSMPEVRMNPDPFSILDTRDFTVNGTIFEMTEPILLLDGEYVPTEYNEESGLFVFTKDFSYATDGKKAINVYADDVVGNDIEFTRHFYIDSTVPVINVTGEALSLTEGVTNYVVPTMSSIELEAEITDNFPDLVVKLNGNTIVTFEEPFIENADLLLPVTYTLDETFALEYGLNTIQILAMDVIGNTTVVEYQVYRLSDDEEIPTVEIYFENESPIDLLRNQTVDLVLEARLDNGEIFDITDDVDVEIAVSNSKVSIDDNMTLTAESAGTSVVTATYFGFTATLEVNVSNPSSGGGNTPTPTPTPTEDIDDEEIPLGAPEFVKGSYINGYTDGTFKAEGLITRAEICAIFDRILTLESDATVSAFSDVATSYWAFKHISTMEEAKLVKGYLNKSFKPQNNITKGEMATIIARVIDLMGLEVTLEECPYEDISEHWAEAEIIKMYSMGIYIEKDGVLFNPDAKLTRAEAVVYINQLMGTVLAPNDYSVPSFRDVPKEHWAYDHIEAAHR